MLTAFTLCVWLHYPWPQQHVLDPTHFRHVGARPPILPWISAFSDYNHVNPISTLLSGLSIPLRMGARSHASYESLLSTSQSMHICIHARKLAHHNSMNGNKSEIVCKKGLHGWKSVIAKTQPKVIFFLVSVHRGAHGWTRIFSSPCMLNIEATVGLNWVGMSRSWSAVASILLRSTTVTLKK